MAINSEKLLPSSKGSALATTKKAISVGSSALAIRKKLISTDSMKSVDSSDPKFLPKTTLEIKTKVIEVDKLLKGSVVNEKKKLAKEKQEDERAKRSKREEDLEKKNKKKDKPKSKLKLPKISFLDRVKDFILNTLLGYGLIKLLEFFEGEDGRALFEGIASIAKFIETVGGAIFNGLITFIDWGYQLYDNFRGWVGDTFGEEGLEKFDTLSKNLNTFLNAAIIGGLALLKFGWLRKGIFGLVKTFKTIFRRGLVRAIKRVSLKLFGKGATKLFGKGISAAGGAIGKGLGAAGSALAKTGVGKFVVKLFGPAANVIAPAVKGAMPAVKGFFGRVPVLGPIMVALFSLLSGEPVGQALFKAGGAAIGGALGTFIPIPILGTLVGEIVGAFVGDLIYYALVKQNPKKAFELLLQSFKGILNVGEAVGKFVSQGFSRFIPEFFKEHPIELFDGLGVRSAATGFAKAVGMYDFLKDVGYAEGKDGQIDKFPNLLQLYNPFGMIPLLIKSFFPPNDTSPDLEKYNLKPESEQGSKGEGYSGSGLGSGGGQEPERRAGNFDVQKSGDIVNIGKDLVSKGFSVAEHPDFTKTPSPSGGSYTPGQGYVSNVHRGKGHYESRAIDVTDWRGSLEDSRARYRSVLDSIYNNGDMGKKLLIHDTWGIADESGKDGPGRHGHPEHMHIEVRDKGGKIGKGLFANLGKPEFVLDADTTGALEDNVPGFLAALNKADYDSALGVLRNYASYEGNMQQFIPIPIPMKSNSQSALPQKKSVSISASGGDHEWNDALYVGG